MSVVVGEVVASVVVVVVVLVAEQHEVGQLGRSAVGPVLHVVRGWTIAT